tara:strand:- start:217 stop:450 length:234 start_codon:yes stop_codon:yes gene_type:complete
MATRDLIVPAFLSTSTVSAIVLRGLSANPDVEGTGTGLVTFENEDFTHPRMKTESLTIPSLASEKFTTSRIKNETLN